MGGAAPIIAAVAPMLLGSLFGGSKKVEQAPAPAPTPVVTTPAPNAAAEAQRLEDEAALETRRATLARARGRTQTILTSLTGTDAGNLQRKTLLGQ